MKVALSGSRGLIGSSVVSLLTSSGDQVIRLIRSATQATDNDVLFDPVAKTADLFKLEGIDAVIHLAGENIASRRWSSERKEIIRASRVNGTQLLSHSLAKLRQPPKVLLCASAIGYYGDRGTSDLDESCSSGKGFLSDLCLKWESATQAAQDRGIRVVHLRLGVVLASNGGALAKMLIPFLIGAGGQIGNGKQYMSWITIDDVAAAIQHCLTSKSLTGPVNLVSPEPVTNAQFTKALGKVLGRATICPVPEFAARLVFGEMADELLLASTKVKPAKLQDSGYRFLYPSLEPALTHVLSRWTTKLHP